ncbi:MAG: hypothetical protein QM784_05730 [Polyangiaceae bacterium]
MVQGRFGVIVPIVRAARVSHWQLRTNLLFSIPPYLLNTVNVALYPKVLEGEGNRERFGAREAMVTMWRETKACTKNPLLRGLFIESAVLQAVAKTVKEYVQPLVVTALSGIAASGFLSTVEPTKRSALLLGFLYFVLNAGAATASRYSHRFDAIDGRPFPWLWSAVMLVGALLTTGAALRGLSSWATVIAVTGFVLLVLLENLWRPLFLDRLDDVSDSRYGAAVLSVEAQFASVGIMLLAPLVGKTADHFGLLGIGLLVCVLGLLTAVVSVRRKRRSLAESTA